MRLKMTPFIVLGAYSRNPFRVASAEVDAPWASTRSMEGAFSLLETSQVLDSVETSGRRFAVLADMLELGPDSPRYHYETGVYGRDLAIDQVFIIGDLAANIGRAYEEKGIPVIYCRDNSVAVDTVRSCRRPGDVILLKGSNGMHLGEVLKGLSE